LSARRLLVATRNEGKLRELRTLLDGTGLHLETLASHPESADVHESGASFDENARIKAAAAARATKLWTIADDSGLEVDVLGREPGVRSARYAGVHGDDAATPPARLGRPIARASRLAMALARPDGEIAATAHGVCEAITPAARRAASATTRVRPARLPRQTMAGLDHHDKNAVSPRQALRLPAPVARAPVRSIRSLVRSHTGA
jgi:XTP/dITP diphosphohydrolase